MNREQGKKRYRVKLNLLGPGLVFCAVGGVLLGLGVILHLCGLSALSVWAWCAAALVFIVLFVLIGIEQHQDHRLYLDAKQENPEIK